MDRQREREGGGGADEAADQQTETEAETQRIEVPQKRNQTNPDKYSPLNSRTKGDFNFSIHSIPPLWYNRKQS